MTSFSYFTELFNARDAIYHSGYYNFPSYQEYIYFKNKVPFVNIFDFHYYSCIYNSVDIYNIYLFLANKIYLYFAEPFHANLSFEINYDMRGVYKNELLQDFRKLNFLRRKYNELLMVGQLYDRGYNGHNYRLDLQYQNNPIIAQEKTNYFGWRFKNYIESFSDDSGYYSEDLNASTRKNRNHNNDNNLYSPWFEEKIKKKSKEALEGRKF